MFCVLKPFLYRENIELPFSVGRFQSYYKAVYEEVRIKGTLNNIFQISRCRENFKITRTIFPRMTIKSISALIIFTIRHFSFYSGK